jgi:hypothetical protein
MINKFSPVTNTNIVKVNNDNNAKNLDLCNLIKYIMQLNNSTTIHFRFNIFY